MFFYSRYIISILIFIFSIIEIAALESESSFCLSFIGDSCREDAKYTARGTYRTQIQDYLITGKTELQDLNIDTLLRVGDREGNGGDPALSEFVNILNNIVTTLESDKALNLTTEGILRKASFSILREKLVKARLLCSNKNKELMLKDTPVTAINIPDTFPQIIILDCEKFTKLSHLDKERLVVHEALYLDNINDDNYFSSNNLLSKYFELKVRTKENTFLTSMAIVTCNFDLYSRNISSADISGTTYGIDNTLIFKQAVRSNCFNIISDLLLRSLIYENFTLPGWLINSILIKNITHNDNLELNNKIYSRVKSIIIKNNTHRKFIKICKNQDSSLIVARPQYDNNSNTDCANIDIYRLLEVLGKDNDYLHAADYLNRLIP